MKLTVVIPVLGQHELATFAIQKVLECSGPETRVLAIDNGGDFEIWNDGRLDCLRMMDNVGVYPTFKIGMFKTDAEVVAFFHSDLIVTEKNFDKRLLDVFEKHPKLGLVGFVGSNQIDVAGGRGFGTTSNFQGKKYEYEKDMGEGKSRTWVWHGSPAKAHGRQDSGYSRGAVVDGCAMVLRRSAWEKIGYREDFPPHHFYDRLISTQMLEAGFEVAVLGIECDHISGQTVNNEKRYYDTAKEWCEEHGVFAPTVNWDSTIYRMAEMKWLQEYRDKKHFIPIKI